MYDATRSHFYHSEIARHLGLRPEDRYFWATYTGAEIDLLVLCARRRLGFEIKRTTTPKTSRSMHSASETLALDELYVVHAGSRSYTMRPGIAALAVRDLETLRIR